ncbi:MAG: hypothetical protein U0165_09865 [Polyangiaceae bacterium]
MPLYSLPTVELVDAGEVSLTTAAGAQLKLATRAYSLTSRTCSRRRVHVARSFDRLFAAFRLGRTSRVAGGRSVPAFSTSFELPPALTGIEVSGVALGGTLPLESGDIEVTWQGATDADQVVVDISEMPSMVQGSAAPRRRCSSSNGHDVRLPSDAIAPGSSVRIEVHRLVETSLAGHPVRSARASVDVISSGVLHRGVVDSAASANGG